MLISKITIKNFRGIDTLENLEVSRYGNYVYPETLLSSEDKFHASPDKKLVFSKPAEEFTYFGPYAAPA